MTGRGNGKSVCFTEDHYQKIFMERFLTPLPLLDSSHFFSSVVISPMNAIFLIARHLPQLDRHSVRHIDMRRSIRSLNRTNIENNRTRIRMTAEKAVFGRCYWIMRILLFVSLLFVVLPHYMHSIIISGLSFVLRFFRLVACYGVTWPYASAHVCMATNKSGSDHSISRCLFSTRLCLRNIFGYEFKRNYLPLRYLCTRYFVNYAGSHDRAWLSIFFALRTPVKLFSSHVWSLFYKRKLHRVRASLPTFRAH